MTRILRYFTLLRKVQYDKGLGLIIRYDEKFKSLVYSSDKQAQPKFKHTPYQSTPKIQSLNSKQEFKHCSKFKAIKTARPKFKAIKKRCLKNPKKFQATLITQRHLNL